MRRSALAALCGALMFAAACTDSPTEPTVPPSEELLSGSCRVERFPLIPIKVRIIVVFHPGRQQLEALARAAAIKLFWDTCHPAAARRLAVGFIDWMNGLQDAGKLRGSQAQVTQLAVMILNGVLEDPITLPEGGGNVGVGLYDNATGGTAKTGNKTAFTKLEAESFNDTDPRLIVVSRKFDNFFLQFFGLFDGNQFPPYWDYDVIKLSGVTNPADKVLKTGKKAVVAFCLLDTDDVDYPDWSSLRIGHNPVSGAGQPAFEILEEVDLAEEGLDGELTCDNMEPAPAPDEIGVGSFRNGLPGLAHATWRGIGKNLGPIATRVLLPQPLDAAVGTLPPIGGRAPSLSPFGIVEVASENPYRLEFTPNGDPGAGSGSIREFEDGATIAWSCGIECSTYPTVRVVDAASGLGVGGVEVTVTLVPQEGLGGSFGDGSTLEATSQFGEGDEGTGFAYFSDLAVNLVLDESGNDGGLFNLVFHADGADPLPSGTFRVSETAPPLGFDAIGAGGLHSCGVTSAGTVSCWGNNQYGQSTAPAGLSGVQGVAAGDTHTCAVTNEGSVACWGEDIYGQSTVPSGLNDAVAVGVGFFHSCALREEGTVICWGGEEQELGQTDVPEGLTGVTAISANGTHTCALKNDGAVVCWGQNNGGQTAVPEALASVNQVAAGGQHTCALKSDGDVSCWGFNGYGQLDIPEGLAGVQFLTSGAQHNCAVLGDGSVTCWGRDEDGQSTVPTGLTNVSQVSGGGFHTCALKNDGEVSCWGNNQFNQATPP